MGERETNTIRAMVDELYRLESRRVFATLVRLTGDFDLAEEVLHEAFAAAIEQWPREGMPANPRAWLVSTGRFKAIDFMRRRTRFDSSVAKLTQELEKIPNGIENWDDAAFRDDHLRLIFTCCHPTLPPDTQVALTLREVCGLTTEEIASAFLTTASTMAQRIVRGKAKIRDARIPYQLPALDEIPDRLDSVLSVIYLIFNEGYSASSGASVTRADLSAEAIRLGRVLLELLPDSEVMGLLALMLFHESRRASRSTPAGDIVLLEDQDRSLWDRDLIAEARQLVERALASRLIGPYTIQAAIASVHAEAQTPEQTDWPRIVTLYNLLLRAAPSPVIELNRAVAVAMRDGPEAGLALVDAILERGELGNYHLAYAARADLCRRSGKTAEARAAYQRALLLTNQEPERRFLERRIRELTQKKTVRACRSAAPSFDYSVERQRNGP